MPGFNLFPFQLIPGYQRQKPGIFCLMNLLQSQFHQHPVLSRKFHHIPHCRKSHVRYHIKTFFHRNPHTVIQHLNKFPGNRRSAQIRIRISAIFLFGINDRICHRYMKDFFSICFIQRKRHLMMVCNNDCKPFFFCIRNFIRSGYSVITGEYRIYTIFQRPGYHSHVNPIAVRNPVANYIIRHSSATVQPCQ